MWGFAVDQGLRGGRRTEIWTCGVGLRSVDVMPTSIEHRLVGHRSFAMTSLLVLLAGVA
jgi:hypothetical protein